jgi:hypothetical protein
MLALHPSVTLLRSPWQLDAIWRANQPGAAEDTVNLAALIREVLDEEVLVPV